MYLKEPTWYKKVAAKNLKGHAEKDVKSKCQPMQGLRGIKIFDYDDQATEHYYCLPTTQQATVMFGMWSSLSIFLIASIAETSATHFDVTSISAWPFLDSWLQLFLC